MAAAPPLPVAPARPIIELQDLEKIYPTETAGLPALGGVSLTVAPGEIVALRGPSGSGKSTLLNILGCLDRPTRGRYLLGGRDVSGLSREEQAWVRLHYIGFIFQSFHLLPRETAVDNVALPLVYAGQGRAERRASALALLSRVGLGERAQRLPTQLSGGQRQRVAIARALACHPRLLLADEPTGALDSRTGREVMELLSALRAEEGLTVILVTHDAQVARHADRIVYLRDGRLEPSPEDTR